MYNRALGEKLTGWETHPVICTFGVAKTKNVPEGYIYFEHYIWEMSILIYYYFYFKGAEVIFDRNEEIQEKGLLILTNTT